MAEGQRQTGTVKWFSGQKGFGFVAPDTGGEDLFVHQTSIRSEGFRILSEGDAVEFFVEQREDGRATAVDVTGPAGSEIPVAASSRGGVFSGWRGRAGGFGRGGYGRGGGRSWGRGGGGGVRGGSGGGGPCYNCGKDGHLARDCLESPQEGGGGRGFGGMCYNCGQSGHLARDCSQSSGASSRGFGGSCYNCGQSGHLARECSQEREALRSASIGGYSGGGRGCYNCGEHGHLARECPNNDDK